MRFWQTTLTALAVSFPSTQAGFLRRSNDGNPSASTYTDTETNITFLGYASTTGFQFGMALPTTPTTDLIVQLVSPLKDGGGWGAIDFGSEMTGYLMIAAWPDTTQTDVVRISPRIATGYEVSNGANLYSASNITITQIPSGTFVNDTHVAATFVCGGCIVADSFKSAVSTGTSTFSYAYALTAVPDPDEDDTQLSDHTLQGELYGPFDVAFKDAESADYASWVKLTSADETGTGNSTTTSTSPATTSSVSASESSSTSSSSDCGSSSSSSSSSTTTSSDDGVGLGVGGISALTVVGLLYMLQAFNIC